MSRSIWDGFYDPNKLISYGRPLNVSVGSRSIGKSTGWGIRLLLDFIQKGDQFIYMRREVEELDVTAPKYFNNSYSLMRDYGYGVNSCEYECTEGMGTYYLNGEPCGYAIPLVKVGKFRSSFETDRIKWILYDEFMKIPGGSNYIGGQNYMKEAAYMQDFYETTARGKGKAWDNRVRMVLLGNAGGLRNPFVIKYGMDRYIRPDSKIIAPKDKLWVFENTDNVPALQGIENSWAYRLASSDEQQYAYHNKFADSLHNDFILRKPEGPRQPMCNIVFEGEKYGVWQHLQAGYLYISHELCQGRQEIALTCTDHSPNYLMVDSWRKHPITQLMRTAYDNGRIRFFDHKCKLVVDFFFKIML